MAPARAPLRLVARRFLRDSTGLALVEFAFAFPVLLLLYLGTFTFADAFACSRKVTTTARSVADLTTRYPSLTQAEAAAILGASAKVLAPYAVSNAVIVLSEVRVASSTTATVVWSKALNGSALATNSTVTVPANMSSTGTYVILGQVTYTYTAALPWGNIGSYTLSDRIMMLPRVSDSVPLS